MLRAYRTVSVPAPSRGGPKDTFLGGYAVDPNVKATRRGSRRDDLAPPLEGPTGGQGLAHQVLAFESYIGFQHDYIGVFAGLVVAIGLLARRGLRTARLQLRR